MSAGFLHALSRLKAKNGDPFNASRKFAHSVMTTATAQPMNDTRASVNEL
jgi:hypothetical protein